MQRQLHQSTHFYDTFTQNDLDANRLGQLSEPQQMFVQFKTKRAWRRLWLSLSAVIVLLIVGYFVDVTAATPERPANIVSAIFRVWYIVFPLFWLLRTLWELRKFRAANRVEMVEGPAHLTQYNVSPVIMYFLHISTIQLEIPPAWAAQFQQGGIYRLYFVPHLNLVLSFEQRND